MAKVKTCQICNKPLRTHREQMANVHSGACRFISGYSMYTPEGVMLTKAGVRHAEKLGVDVSHLPVYER